MDPILSIQKVMKFEETQEKEDQNERSWITCIHKTISIRKNKEARHY